jgi:hypothetical protein
MSIQGKLILNLVLNIILVIAQKLDYNLQYINEDLKPDVCS